MINYPMYGEPYHQIAVGPLHQLNIVPFRANNIQTMELTKDRDLIILVIFTRKYKYYDDDDNDV